MPPAALVPIVVVPRAKILMLEAGYQEEKERSGGLQGGMPEMGSTAYRLAGRLA